MKNQEVHKILRRNKPGIRLNDIEDPPPDYVRPEGFNMVQPVLQYRSGKQLEEDDSVKYYRDLKEEMSRYRYIYKSRKKNIVRVALRFTCFAKRNWKFKLQFSNASGTRIASGSEFEEDEVGWDSPLTRRENDLHPSSSRYIRPDLCIFVSICFNASIHHHFMYRRENKEDTGKIHSEL